MHTGGTICERELGHPAISMGLKQERALTGLCGSGLGELGHPAGRSGTPTRILDTPPFIFLRLQTGLRCKIVKTKEFPAKSPRIRSYVKFRPHLAASI